MYLSYLYTFGKHTFDKKYVSRGDSKLGPEWDIDELSNKIKTFVYVPHIILSLKSRTGFHGYETVRFSMTSQPY
jgi:hypothetical protein